MNKTLKTIIFIFTVLGFGGLVYSCKPTEQKKDVSENTNQYFISLDKKANDFNSLTPSLAEGAKEYNHITESIEKDYNEKKISETEKTQLFTNLNTKYIPWFADRSTKILKSTTWQENDIDLIKQQSHKLINDNTIAKDSPQYKNIETMYKTTQNYFEAKSICNNASFGSVQHAQSIIEEVKRLQTDKNLKYCQPLMKDLATVTQKMQIGHYDMIKNEITRLDNMDKNNPAEYKNRVKKVETAINEYNNISQSLYGNNRYYDQMMIEFRNVTQKHQYLEM